MTSFEGVDCQLVAEDASGEGNDQGELVLYAYAGAAVRGYTGSDLQAGGIPRVLPPRLNSTWRTGDRFRRIWSGGAFQLAFVCREDDLLVLSTGEMTNPRPMEEILRLGAEQFLINFPSCSRLLFLKTI